LAATRQFRQAAAGNTSCKSKASKKAKTRRTAD
jgi:hypothetical protein